MNKATLPILTGAALCLLLGAGCSDPVPVTMVEPPADAESLLVIPGELAAPDPGDPPLAMEGEEVMAVEAEAAMRRLEEELDALQVNPAIVWIEQAAVREEPTPVGLMMTVLVRGERVSVLNDKAPEQGFVHVRMRNGATGFVKQEALLLGDVEELFCFDNSPFFTAPDSTAKPADWLRMGTPTFVLASKGAWVEVMLVDGRKGWMLASDLADDTTVLDLGGS